MAVKKKQQQPKLCSVCGSKMVISGRLSHGDWYKCSMCPITNYVQTKWTCEHCGITTRSSTPHQQCHICKQCSPNHLSIPLEAVIQYFIDLGFREYEIIDSDEPQVDIILASGPFKLYIVVQMEGIPWDGSFVLFSVDHDLSDDYTEHSEARILGIDCPSFFDDLRLAAITQIRADMAEIKRMDPATDMADTRGKLAVWNDALAKLGNGTPQANPLATHHQAHHQVNS